MEYVISITNSLNDIAQNLKRVDYLSIIIEVSLNILVIITSFIIVRIQINSDRKKYEISEKINLLNKIIDEQIILNDKLILLIERSQNKTILNKIIIISDIYNESQNEEESKSKICDFLESLKKDYLIICYELLNDLNNYKTQIKNNSDMLEEHLSKLENFKEINNYEDEIDHLIIYNGLQIDKIDSIIEEINSSLESDINFIIKIIIDSIKNIDIEGKNYLNCIREQRDMVNNKIKSNKSNLYKLKFELIKELAE